MTQHEGEAILSCQLVKLDICDIVSLPLEYRYISVIYDTDSLAGGIFLVYKKNFGTLLQ